MEKLIHMEAYKTRIIYEDYITHNTKNPMSYIVNGYAMKDRFINSEEILNYYKPILLPIALMNKESRLKKSQGSIEAMNYPDELLCFYAIYNRYDGKGIYESRYCLPNICGLMKKYNNKYFKSYVQKVPTNVPGFIDFMAKYCPERINTNLIKVDTSHSDFIRILSCAMNIPYEHSYDENYKIVIQVLSKINDLPEVRQFMTENINKPLIFALCHHYDVSLLPLAMADSDKYHFNHECGNTMHYYTELIKNDRYEGPPLEVRNYKDYPDLILLMIKKRYIKLLGSTILNTYLSFQLENLEMVKAISDYLVDEYPDTTFELSINSRIPSCKNYDGPIFTMRQLGKRRISRDKDLDNFYKLVAQGNIIIIDHKLLFDDEEYIAAIMQNRESFLRLRNTLMKFSSYDAASSRRIKSASK